MASSVYECSSSPSKLFPDAWIWAYPAVYAVHLLDERLWGIGTAEFATRHLGIYLTNEAWWLVNVPSTLAMLGVAALVAVGRWPQWVAVALATHLALHSLGRVPATLWLGMWSPGLASGLLLCVPLAWLTFSVGNRGLSRGQLRAGLVTGIASFQPFWHLLLLPLGVLPEAPA